MKPTTRCWNCKESLPLDCFIASALRYKGECKACRKKSNAKYYPKYMAALAEFKERKQ